MSNLVKTGKGICAIGELNAEFTLCMDAFDLGTDEDGYEWAQTNRKTVSCPDCVRVIRYCKSLRVHRSVR
jgi:hypothetical protein